MIESLSGPDGGLAAAAAARQTVAFAAGPEGFHKEAAAGSDRTVVGNHPEAEQAALKKNFGGIYELLIEAAPLKPPRFYVVRVPRWLSLLRSLPKEGCCLRDYWAQ